MSRDLLEKAVQTTKIILLCTEVILSGRVSDSLLGLERLVKEQELMRSRLLEEMIRRDAERQRQISDLTENLSGLASASSANNKAEELSGVPQLPRNNVNQHIVDLAAENEHERRRAPSRLGDRGPNMYHLVAQNFNAFQKPSATHTQDAKVFGPQKQHITLRGDRHISPRDLQSMAPRVIADIPPSRTAPGSGTSKGLNAAAASTTRTAAPCQRH